MCPPFTRSEAPGQQINQIVFWVNSVSFAVHVSVKLVYIRASGTRAS